MFPPRIGMLVLSDHTQVSEITIKRLSEGKRLPQAFSLGSAGIAPRWRHKHNRSAGERRAIFTKITTIHLVPPTSAYTNERARSPLRPSTSPRVQNNRLPLIENELGGGDTRLPSERRSNQKCLKGCSLLSVLQVVYKCSSSVNTSS